MHPTHWLISTQVWAGVAEVSADVLRRLPPGRLRVRIFTSDRSTNTEPDRPNGADVRGRESLDRGLEAVVLCYSPLAQSVGLLRCFDGLRGSGD